jgi:putative peptide zinc metalloprotease protein
MDIQKKQARLEGVQGVLPLQARKDIQIEEQIYEGKTFYTAKDPLTLRYYRMKDLEYFIFTLLDGTREVKDIQDEVEKKFGGLKVSEGQIKEFIIMLRNFNFLETFGPQSYSLLYQRRGQKRWAKIKQKFMSFFFITVPLVDPDRFFNRIYPHLKFIFTRRFFHIWLLFMAIFFFIILTHSGEFFHQITGFFNLKNLALVWVAIMIIKTLHEVGHSLLCKHYGGEVHELGILFIVLTPWMYVNVSDAWIFQKSRQRFLVTVAGLMTELLAASFAAILWWITRPGVLNSLCYNIVIVCSVDNILRNANPLLRYDGYYALGDFLEIPNLRIRAFGYLKLLLKKYLLRVPIPDTDPDKETSRRRKWIFLIYGPLSFVYLNFIILAIAGFIGKKFFILGLFLAGMMIFRSFLMPIQKGVAFAFRSRAQMGHGRPVLIGAAFLPVAFVIFLLTYQVHLKVVSPCSVEPMDYAVVRTEGAGFLEKLLCDQGDRVKRNQVLALLKNQELMTQYEKLRISHAGLLQTKRKALGLSKHVDYDQVEFEIGKIEKEIEKLKEKIEKLTVLALKDGIILTSNLKERIGDFLGEGEVFCEMGFLEGAQVRVIISEEDFSEIKEGLQVELKAYAYAEKIFQGEVMDISPVRVENLENLALSSKFGGTLPTEKLSKAGEMPKLPFFQVTMRIDNPGHLLKPGMTGISKIYCERKSLIVLLYNKILRLIKPERILIL